MPIVDIATVDKMCKVAREGDTAGRTEREEFLGAPPWVRMCMRLAAIFPERSDALRALARDFEGNGSTGPRWVGPSR
jgi:hypothetical protein